MTYTTHTKAERWSLPFRFAPGNNVAVACCASMAAALLSVVGAVWPSWAIAHVDEGGIVETTSAVMLFSAAVVAVVSLRGLPRLYISLGCFLLAEREIDAEVFAADSPPAVAFAALDNLLDPTWVRVLLGLVLLSGVVWHGIPTAWKAVKARAPFLPIFILAGLAAVVAQLLEEVAKTYGADLSEIGQLRLFVLEETLEMFFSVGIFASVLIGWRKSQLQETLHDTPFVFKSNDSRVPITNEGVKGRHSILYSRVGDADGHDLSCR